jgi:hypothetical protein
MESTRRRFLKLAGTAALATAATPLLSACGGIVRADLNGTGNDAVGPQLGPELSDVLLYHASLAPSGHNTQPWTVTVQAPDRLVIGSDKRRWLAGVDPENREMLLSIGAFLEYLIIAANHHGYDIQYRVIAQTAFDQDIVEVTLTAAAPRPGTMDLIRRRRTVRNGYTSKEISAADVATLSRPFVGDLLFIPRQSRQGRYLQDGTVEANRLQAYREVAQEELAQWIRWTDEDAQRERNGLTPEGMEITDIAGWYVRHFMDRQSVLTRKFREQTIDMVHKQVHEGGGWLVIASTNSDIPTLIETGRKFGRMLLLLRPRMIAVHPMTQMLEEAPLRDSVAKELGIEGSMQFILRTGYLTAYPEPVSLRMPISMFVSLNSKGGLRSDPN